MNNSYTRTERAHLEAVKLLPCSLCDAAGPSSAHHVRQSIAYSVVALCHDCHQGAKNGWHGQRALWKVYRMDEWDALIITFRRLLEGV